MKAFLQRVSGKCEIHSQLEGQSKTESFSGFGYVVLLGWEGSDEQSLEELEKREQWIFDKVMGLRVFPNAEGKMDLNLGDYCKEKNTEGGILWVPQFTLAGELKKGFRPSFTKALQPKLAKERFLSFQKRARSPQSDLKQIFGVFSAEMNLSFTNWGPISLHL